MKNSNPTLPSVSIALCTYNGERFLREQLDSILQQDYDNISEVICVDDKSTDQTWTILNEYASKYPVFKVFKNEKNQGFIKNFERAITLCNSSLIALSDQDDIWYLNKISTLVNKIGDSLMVYSNNEYIDKDGKPMGIRFSDKRNIATITSCLSFTLYNVISGHTILFKKELLKYALPFASDIHYDWWLGFCAAQHSDIQVINEPLVGYRQHISNAVGGYGLNDKVESYNILDETIVRMRYFAKKIDSNLVNEKKVLDLIIMSYANRSIKMKLKRISVFWQERDNILLFKKRSKIRKMIYCIKVYWKYE